MANNDPEQEEIVCIDANKFVYQKKDNKGNTKRCFEINKDI